MQQGIAFSVLQANENILPHIKSGITPVHTGERIGHRQPEGVQL
jgi:hypothetical protein